jgi:cell division inhibitor SulA
MKILKELHILLINHPIWSDDERIEDSRAISTGFPELDEALPGTGWSRSGLVGIHVPREGAGELSVLLPALAQISKEERKVVFVAPPYLPYAPSLAQAGVDLSRYMLVKVQSLESRLWAIEQALRSGDCGAVVFWTQGMDKHHLQRLHLAALEGGAIGFAFDHKDFDETMRGIIPVSLAMRPCQGAKVHIQILNQKDASSSVSFSLSIPSNNPVLSTPLPPTRGRVAHIPAWRHVQTRTKTFSTALPDQEWLLQGIVA